MDYARGRMARRAATISPLSPTSKVASSWKAGPGFAKSQEAGAGLPDLREAARGCQVLEGRPSSCPRRLKQGCQVLEKQTADKPVKNSTNPPIIFEKSGLLIRSFS